MFQRANWDELVRELGRMSAFEVSIEYCDKGWVRGAGWGGEVCKDAVALAVLSVLGTVLPYYK